MAGKSTALQGPVAFGCAEPKILQGSQRAISSAKINVTGQNPKQSLACGEDDMST